MVNDRKTDGHRGTIYITSELKDLIDQEGLNLSRFLRDKLDEHFGSIEGPKNKILNLRLELDKIRKNKLSLEADETRIKRELKENEEKIKEIKARREKLKSLGNPSEREFKFLTNIKEVYGKIGIEVWEDYKTNFKKNIKFPEFLKLVKAICEHEEHKKIG